MDKISSLVKEINYCIKLKKQINLINEKTIIKQLTFEVLDTLSKPAWDKLTQQSGYGNSLYNMLNACFYIPPKPEPIKGMYGYWEKTPENMPGYRMIFDEMHKTWIIALYNGELAAALNITYDENADAWIWNVCRNPEDKKLRNLGIGKWLIKYALDFLHAHFFNKVFLIALNTPGPRQKYFESIGFRPTDMILDNGHVMEFIMGTDYKPFFTISLQTDLDI